MERFKKKIIFIAEVFWKLLTPKNVVTWIDESSCFRTPFGSQVFNGSETLLKSKRQHLYANFPLISYKCNCQTCLLEASEILGLFFNTLTSDHMYSCYIWEKFLQQLQTQLSSKPKTFSQIFIAFSRSTEKFQPFQTEYQLHSLNIFEVIDSKKCGYLNARKLLFQNAIGKSTS